ncbi:type II toxin-antitoxin system RelE/ParE family toxin [Glycomyces albidus]|jgi:hypothetical protein|uniref:Type II toxin-antitoxin system RelE/ParE family toxin n=1 Tax=Glycomyces albidus TaxID=2656774 RepID=A0A6L5G804_9ACTN|nr:type II toxin-antitoxin system RelE/ParE family toxin [Glycomyces albidus]MQM25751.1 type II toxin-antitoxin system RelE/ParE family toxin [Glycomyces albidus]
MTEYFTIELEPEVRQWLESLTRPEYDRVEFYGDLLTEFGGDLGEPYSKHLGGKVRELRFYLPQRRVRITYWLAPDRRIVLLTVFAKTRPQERAEIQRARRAQLECESWHASAHDVYDRNMEEK